MGSKENGPRIQLQRHELSLSGTCCLSHHPIRIKLEILSGEQTPNLLKTARVSILIELLSWSDHDRDDIRMRMSVPTDVFEQSRMALKKMRDSIGKHISDGLKKIRH